MVLFKVQLELLVLYHLIYQVSCNHVIHVIISIYSVSDTPTGLTATRLSTGLAQVRLSWSTVSGATGYEVYYQLSSNTPVSVGTTSSTTINIASGLFRGITYTFYVVSYGSASLPSGNASVLLTFSKFLITIKLIYFEFR